ncbi:hypothetical protein A3D78_07050 [Candidatus Gottesmanbacteria bacterium RIFCSPHIGHO2_02_FULL_39_14]|uniref:Glycerophosphoryl diester phosphodiesterase membrane domain-containing protein n=2 Tax=Candidatus Gottesmaniibacteriota TaxID=1752720 RepID=A0A1F5ZTW2_9BACT|nr:MAG: hypothetical protein A3D78_07050 [Candidatus Gottesmanbacteria bacterium RIFCSPHIGHO2_02_FULL_39_14]OGG31220.1 MAG: hypothetical protein A3I51_05105 [Candidatus Gottesmanbacteria bacterium RIFCSPLOWO2_02_FULL_38_8]
MITPENSSTSQINHLVSPTLLLNTSWQIYKKKWKTLIKLLIFFKLLYLPVILYQPISTLSKSFFTHPSISIAIIIIIYIIYSSFILSLETIALILYLASENEKTDIKNLFKSSLSLIFPYWWLLSLEILIFMGGFIFFFVPGLIFLIWFSFSAYLLILENIKGINALFVSKELVKERFWEVTGRIFVISVISLLFSLFISLISNIPKLITLFSNPEVFFSSLTASASQTQNVQPLPFTHVLKNFIIMTFQSITISSFAVIYNILLYRNAKSVYGKAYPQPAKKSKLLMMLPAIIALLTVILLFGIVIFFVVFNPLRSPYPSSLSPSGFTYPTRIPTP